MGKLLRAMGLSRREARPSHPEADAKARDASAEGGPMTPREPRAADPGKRLTLRFQDEVRFGQKGRVCHRWYTRGQRPPGSCDRRHTWAHLFAAIRPATGQDFALVLPEVSTRAMQAFLDGFAARLAPDEHAVLVLDQAGWHEARALRPPGNVTLVSLPACSPELNPVEKVWTRGR